MILAPALRVRQVRESRCPPRGSLGCSRTRVAEARDGVEAPGLRGASIEREAIDQLVLECREEALARLRPSALRAAGHDTDEFGATEAAARRLASEDCGQRARGTSLVSVAGGQPPPDRPRPPARCQLICQLTAFRLRLCRSAQCNAQGDCFGSDLEANRSRRTCVTGSISTLYARWWVVVDSNHRRHKPPDLQSGPIGRSGNHPRDRVRRESGRAGPARGNGAAGRSRRSQRGDSNPQPPVYKTGALPLSYAGQRPEPRIVVSGRSGGKESEPAAAPRITARRGVGRGRAVRTRHAGSRRGSGTPPAAHRRRSSRAARTRVPARRPPAR